MLASIEDPEERCYLLPAAQHLSEGLRNSTKAHIPIALSQLW
jgi:hypothetical protein